jgi:preprotein translocase subunit SecA
VIKSEVTRVLINVQIQSPEQLEQASEQIEEGLAHLENVQYKHDEFAEGGEPVEQAEPAPQHGRRGAGRDGRRSGALAGMPKVGRNDPCPCGSGKKFKQCHGKLS